MHSINNCMRGWECEKDVGMGLCQYIDLCFHASSLPCLHVFWHAIPTSFYIFNVFYFLVCNGLTTIGWKWNCFVNTAHTYCCLLIALHTIYEQIDIFYTRLPQYLSSSATPSTDSSGRNDMLNGDCVCCVSKLQNLFFILHIHRIKVMNVSKRHCLWAINAKVCT